MGEEKGEDSGPGQGGNDSQLKGGKSSKGSGMAGSKESTSSGFNVIDPRIIKPDPASNDVRVYFNAGTKEDFSLRIYRSGETDRQLAKFRTKNDSEWRDSIQIKGKKRDERIGLVLELHPEEFEYALEVVIFHG